MFKDKNFGLPKNLVESARSVMQNQYGKKKPPVKKSATTSSNKLSENHVVKFTFYLKENFHINELTEEEIAWIYENEYVQWLEEGLTISDLTPEEEAKRKKEEREREIEREREERRQHDERAKRYEKIPMV